MNGVGPKLALAILSGMDEDAFMRCVRDDDSKALTKLPGVGKKTAERLIIEMRDRFPQWQPGHDAPLELEGANGQPAAHNSLADAESALVSLGYKLTEASKMLADLDHSLSTEALIKAALTKRMTG